MPRPRCRKCGSANVGRELCDDFLEGKYTEYLCCDCRHCWQVKGEWQPEEGEKE